VLTGPETIVLPGAELRYWPRFLPTEEADNLLGVITAKTPWVQSEIRIAGRVIAIPRLNAWYGNERADYSYSGVTLTTLPWTDTLARLKLETEKITGYRFNSALVNLYRDHRDSVDWHADNEPELGAQPVVASISLGEERCFELRRRDNHREKFKLPLVNGSLLLMAGDIQNQWQHRVPKEKSPCGQRVNITFRTVHNGV
jgi:alkylated DNA repair dioxygenase AlkB